LWPSARHIRHETSKICIDNCTLAAPGGKILYLAAARWLSINARCRQTACGLTLLPCLLTGPPEFGKRRAFPIVSNTYPVVNQ
jgi:hypothetical protein